MEELALHKVRKGQTTEAGFLDGAGKGTIAGATAAIELMDFSCAAETFSKVIIPVASCLPSD